MLQKHTVLRAALLTPELVRADGSVVRHPLVFILLAGRGCERNGDMSRR